MSSKKVLFAFLRLSLACALVAPFSLAADFLWLSDIHFDPLADRALVDQLAAAEPEKWAEILGTSANKNFPAYGRDTNWPLFSSLLHATVKAAPKAEFTIVTGDLLVHHFREQFDGAASVHDDAAFRAFVRKSVEFVALQLKQRSAGKPVFVTLGNNDDECGDYAIQPDGPFLQDTAKAVGELAGLPNSDSYRHLGSYSVGVPSLKHARIIVLDTVFLSPRYSDRCGRGAADAGDQLLSWLGKELDAAQSRHEKVWLVYHIPPGVDAFATTHAKTPGAVTLLWKESYVERFLALLAQHAGVVGPNFAGHVHVDDFRLLGGDAKFSPFVAIASAISPITGQNPTFRVVAVDSHAELRDEQIYYLKNLAEAGKGADAVWEMEYDFDKQWNVKGLNAETYSSLFSRLGSDAGATAQWLTLYSTSHVPNSLTVDNFRPVYCTENSLSAKAYQACAAGAPKESHHGKTTN